MPKENFPYEAIAVLGRVLEKNSGKYESGHWRRVHFGEHCKHAKEHLDNLNNWPNISFFAEDHLAHAFVRLAMAVAVRESEDKLPIKVPDNLKKDRPYSWVDNWATKQVRTAQELNKIAKEIDDILAQYTWHDDWM